MNEFTGQVLGEIGALRLMVPHVYMLGFLHDANPVAAAKAFREKHGGSKKWNGPPGVELHPVELEALAQAADEAFARMLDGIVARVEEEVANCRPRG